jgi:DNA-binding MarR family transcriptional regulator
MFGLFFFDGEIHGRMPQVSSALGLNPGQMKALMQLSPDVPTPMRELAESWGCDASYVTSLIDGLEERGFATRRPHASDRRLKTVALTAAGTRARDRTLELLFEPPSGFNALSAAEQRQLRDLMQKVTEAQRANEPATPRGKMGVQGR